MRTKILTLFFTLMSVLSVKAGNSIYIDDVTAQAGDIITLSVQMTNTEADKYCGFQFDVVLPEGVSFVQNDGFYEAELSTQRTTARKTNFFDSVLLSDGSLRILCNTSASNSEVGHLYCFSGTSGEVCTIKVKVDENIKAGKHSIVLKNIALSDYSSVSHAVSDYTMELKVPSIEVTSVSLNKTTLNLVEGDTENLTATVMPANATEQGVAWTSSNGNVATVDAQGKVTAVAEGTAIITATSVNGKTAQCAVVVSKKANPVTAITLNKTTLRLTEGENEILTVTYTPEDADGRSVTWTSSNGNVATVDAQGKVTAVVEGTAIITATSVNGKTAQCAVVVSKKANPVTAITLNKTTLRLTEGENEILTVTYTPENADGRSVTWTSSNGNVATVDAQGKVTAVVEGTAIITATSVNGKIAQCVAIVENDTENISFADLNVKAVCIENWDTDGNGKLSYAEAAAVSSLGEVFRDNKDITSFEELQYFTGLTEIGNDAFSGCEELTSVIIPDNVTRIGDGAFWCARKLSSVNIPKNVKRIEFGAFFECHSLSSVTFPQGLESIASWAFYACNLDVINIPSSVTEIGTDRSFPDNSPSSIIVEDGNPVYDSRNNCNAIIETRTNTLLVGSNNTIIPDDITYIGSWAFSGCDKIKTIKIPNSVTCIDTWAFTGCKNMDTITIPNSVTVMKGAIFYGCRGLTSVSLPNSITKIDDNTFQGCESLTSITIPGSVATIVHGAFEGCNNLTSITVLRKEPAAIETANAFSNYDATLYVPYGCKSKYEEADYWKDFKEIVEKNFIKGDVNGDDIVTMADANMVVNYFLATDKPEDFNVEAADVNGDGDITMADANMIVNMFLNGTTTEVTNKHEAVDLGLSVKWATCNVGAENPQDYGDYFAWGETEPKDDYDWPTYKWCNGSYNTQTKYNANSYYGTVDNRTTLEPVDDAATVNWGGSWRMPTYKEQTALRDSCYWEWTTNYNDKGVSGYIVYKAKAAADRGLKKHIGSSTTTSATYSLSDNHIFLPTAGYRGSWDSYYTKQGGGYYWSDMVFPNHDAYILFICPEDVCWRNYDRSCGQSIRPVCP